jgi:hypothetical protein
LVNRVGARMDQRETPSFDNLQWLHDKYERLLDHEEDRIQAWATLLISLNSGLVAIAGYWLSLYAFGIHFFEALFLTSVGGIAACAGWYAVGYRMHEVHMYWRESLRALERTATGVMPHLDGDVRTWWNRNGPPVALSEPMVSKDAVIDARLEGSRVNWYPVSTMAKLMPKYIGWAWAVVAVLATLATIVFGLGLESRI